MTVTIPVWRSSKVQIEDCLHISNVSDKKIGCRDGRLLFVFEKKKKKSKGKRKKKKEKKEREKKRERGEEEKKKKGEWGEGKENFIYVKRMSVQNQKKRTTENIERLTFRQKYMLLLCHDLRMARGKLMTRSSKLLPAPAAPRFLVSEAG